MIETQNTEFGKIPKSWKVSTLGEVSSLVTDGAHKSPKLREGGRFMASVKDMQYNHFDFSNCKTISESDFDELKKGNCSPQKGDILLSKDGANCLDIIFEYMQDEEIVLLSSIAIARIKPEFCSTFFRYFLLSPNCQYIMRNQFVSGSAIPRVILKDFKKVSLPIPPLPEQKAIAQVLKSLDDKIDLLHRQNKTLEAMAETLFRQWFVEEPDDDWEEKPLSHIATFLNGLACQKYPPTNVIDKLPVLKIRELKDGFTDNSDWASTDIPDKYFVSNGDVIFSWSASLLVKIWDGTDCILNQHLFKVTSDLYPKWFYYLWSKYHLDQFIAIARAHATTMGHIKRGDLDEALVFIPPEEILQKMDYSFDPIIEKIIANNKQLTSLTNLRDTLLPKLMSGEVRVSESRIFTD